MTKQEVLNLQQSLARVGNLKGAKFVYAIAKNNAKIEQEEKALQEVLKYSDDFVIYDKKRIELAKSNAKIKMGQPETKPMKNDPTNFEYVIENQDKFDKELGALREEYKSVIDARDKQIADFNELLKTESDFKPYMIEQKDIPDDINAQQLMGIFCIIKDEEPTEVKKIKPNKDHK